MHSSISSSNSLERVIPAHKWGRLAVISFCCALLLTLGWEFYWRSKGYAPTLNDNKDNWALIREKVEMYPERTVLIGSSRMLFNFNLDVWKLKHGETPLQLSTVGTNASVYLDDLANNSKFKGTLLVGITPPLFFVPEGMPINLPTGNIKHYKRFSPAQRISHFIAQAFDHRFAFMEQEDIPLEKLLASLPIANRADAQLHPKLPPYFMEMDERRQGKMTQKMEKDGEFQKLVQDGWLPLFTPPPPPPIFTHEEFMKMFAEHMNKVLLKAKSDVAKIQARGGKVILVRFPSTGKVRELENKFAPRVAFWNRIASELGADQAIHFEDYPQLSHFQCPEWSHLSSSDGIKFTKELVQLIN